MASLKRFKVEDLLRFTFDHGVTIKGRKLLVFGIKSCSVSVSIDVCEIKKKGVR
jgi:hypothetical protein